MKYPIFSLSLLVVFSFLISPLKAELSPEEVVNKTAEKFLKKNDDKIKDKETWKQCYNKCIMNSCTTCNGDGSCEDPPCSSWGSCSTCDGTCVAVGDGLGFCSTGCSIGCRF